MEYAIEAINNAGTCVGLLASDGIVMASERRLTSGLLAPPAPGRSDKTYALAAHAACNVAGLTADANILIELARQQAGVYQYQYQEPIPVEQLVQFVCDEKQYYTQRGGLRPFGVAFLFAGYDEHYGFQLYQSDPSGNYSGWKATVIGANNQAGKSLLKTEYQKATAPTETAMAAPGEEGEGRIPTVPEALRLAVKVLNKTMDGTGAAAVEKVELFTMTLAKDDENDADINLIQKPKRVIHRILSPAETQAVLDAVEQEAAAAGDS